MAGTRDGEAAAARGEDAGLVSLRDGWRGLALYVQGDPAAVPQGLSIIGDNRGMDTLSMSLWARWRELRAKRDRAVRIAEAAAAVIAEGYRERGQEVPPVFLRDDEQGGKVLPFRPAVRPARGRHQRQPRVLAGRSPA